MSSAVWSGLCRGSEAPTPTGTCVHPTRDSTRRVLRVVFSMGTLPATVVTASRSRSGCPQASIRATASSWPGSTSRITGFGLTLAPPTLNQSGKLPLFERHVQGDREGCREEQIPEPPLLQCKTNRRQIEWQQQQRGETFLFSVFAHRTVDVGHATDQRGPAEVVDERYAATPVGAPYP